MPQPILVVVAAVVVLVIAGCRDDENERLADQAERNLERQSAQELRNMEVHREVAEGTRRLVEADAAARQEIVALHRDVQLERSELGRQRDLLELDRRDVANARNREPVIAEAIQAVGLMLACAIPLLIAWQILRRSDAGDENAVMAELLVEELSSPNLILPHARSVSAEFDKTPRIRSQAPGSSKPI